MDITILIPSHNRHRYLNRIISYYEQFNVKVLIADSSNQVYGPSMPNQNFTYYHLPHLSLPKKLAFALSKISTKYVAMCADDDFITKNGIEHCISFLNENTDYIAAQGNCVCYNKADTINKAVEFYPMYFDQLNFEIYRNDFFDRIDLFFKQYRTIFCAVHYTKILQLTFSQTINISNLFLNEYLTAIIPLSMGMYKELNVFYQVRENAEDSGDKTTDNLDRIIENEKYKEEFNLYINYIAQIIIKNYPQIGEDKIKNKLIETLKNFSATLNEKSIKIVSFKKQIGNFVGKTIVGKKLVKINRYLEREKMLKLIIQSKKDKLSLKQIENTIKLFAASINE